MAASEHDPWTVVIIAELDRTLDKIYQISRDTSLAKIMKTWKEEFLLLGDWRFLSPNKEYEYEDWMSLDMVGETVLKSGIVNLKAKLSYAPKPQPVGEIFVQHRDQCHLLHVEPNQKLYKVLSSLSGRTSACQCNDEQLNVFDTVEEAGLENYSFIHEPRQWMNVSVKLSYGDIVIIRVPEDSLVLHLVQEIQRYEMDEFSLEYEGRHLKADKRVRDLKQVIEVTSVQFVVEIRGRKITWTSKSEPIDFSQFISNLSSKGNFKEAELEALEYRCIGCQRCISKSVDDNQLLPLQCCKEKSLTLKASLVLDKNLNSATIAMIECLQNYFVRLFQRKHEYGRTNATQRFSKRLKNKISELEMSLSTAVMNIEDLLTIIKDLDNEVKRLKKNKEEEMVELERNMSVPPGVQLQVVFYAEQFSIQAARPEVQLLGESSDSHDPFLNCILPGLHPGWVAFDDARNALQPLFDTGNIRGIEQRRGTKRGKTAVEVTHPDDAKDQTGDPGYDDIDGRHYSSDDLEEEMSTVIIAQGDDAMEKQLKKIAEIDEVIESGEVLIVAGRRRTVLLLHGLQSGVEMCIDYHPEQFSIAKTRPEVQSWGEYSDSRRHYLDCIVPRLQAGWAMFDDVKKALQPLFDNGNIRGITQLQGNKNMRTVAAVQHPDDAADRTGDQGFDSISGRHYSSKSVEEVKFIAITAPGDDHMKTQLETIPRIATVYKGGEVLIVSGSRRITLRVYDLPIINEI